MSDVMERSTVQAAQAAWVLRVLGVTLAEPGTGGLTDTDIDGDEDDGADAPAATEHPAARLALEVDALVQQCDAASDMIDANPEAEPALEAALDHAAAARSALAIGDHPAATSAIADSRAALSTVSATLQAAVNAMEQGADLPTPPARREGEVVRLGKALLRWSQARSSAAQQIESLQAAILDAHREDPDLPAIEANLDRLEVILEQLDDRLALKLHELRATKDPTAKAAISAEARQVVEGYRAYLARDGLINDVDDNGYVQLDIKVTFETALADILPMI